MKKNVSPFIISGDMIESKLKVYCSEIAVITIRNDRKWRCEMEVNYNKLWKLMIDRDMPNKSELRTLTGIGTNTLAKLSKNKQVSMEVLIKICDKLDCDISDICEFTKEN